MGLTTSSTGSNALDQNSFNKETDYAYTVAFAGNPNVGKTSIFNNLTGMHQHTGNWPGKTVSNAYGVYKTTGEGGNLLLVDLPGTYSLMSNSQEEEIARDYICFGGADACVVVVDATCLERNLNLVLQIVEMTPNVIVCVNLLDEAKKKSIKVDLDKLSELLGVPVVGTVANKRKTLAKLVDAVYDKLQHQSKSVPYVVKYSEDVEAFVRDTHAEIVKLLPADKSYLARWVSLKLLEENSYIYDTLKENFGIDIANNARIRKKLEKLKPKLSSMCDSIVMQIVRTAEEIRSKTCEFRDSSYNSRDRKIDKILTSKKFGIPIMLVFLACIFWITITRCELPITAFIKLIRIYTR